MLLTATLLLVFAMIAAGQGQRHHRLPFGVDVNTAITQTDQEDPGTYGHRVYYSLTVRRILGPYSRPGHGYQ